MLFQVNSRIYVFTNRQDLAINTANREGANYILAQDPDADRFAAAERKYELHVSLWPACLCWN